MPQASGSYITFGDVFEHAGALTNQNLARAPIAGQTVVFGVGPMQARIRASGAVWSNTEGVRQIVVSNATPVGEANTNSSNPGYQTVAAPKDTRPQPKVIAALGRAIARGEEIRAEDIVWLDAPSLAPRDALEDADFLIGKTARRELNAHMPLRAIDVIEKPAIRRNETVTLVYEASGIKLSLRGRALSDAPLGATVRVVNPQSKKILDAIVEGPGTARVVMSQVSAQFVNRNGTN
ncbi:hypothetical protein PsB1_1601 [Candidatus Phycosocius spiralis]|uniref:Flagella basal body P-ring formation protein FlgA n=2 Tax=Candidatus Phycosocius spiralis TaxID=2815099 RepID=A0ABQ4PWQ4_9PROT|nr:hypothetical protein PsB1_1601 [Candidatus Phycosocius spiralis]